MPSRSLDDAHPALAAAWRAVEAEYEAAHPGHNLIITCTHRSVTEQSALYAQGRTKPGPIVTQLDGVTKRSNHNHKPSRALDFCVSVNGKVTWSLDAYTPVGLLAEAHGLIWGGNWPKFKDAPHVELPQTYP